MSTMKCSCGTALKIKPEMAGKQIRCPACKSVMSVPADAAAETIGVAADTSLAPADPASANRPRLRSEAMRATTPVTSVQATAASEGPVVKTVAAIVPNLAAAAIPDPPPVAQRWSEPPPKSDPPPPQPVSETRPRQPRVSPPLPPPVVPPVVPPRQNSLPEAPELDAEGPAFSLTELAPSALDVPAAPKIAPQQPAPAIASRASPGRASLRQPATWPKSWWIVGGAAAVILLILAFQLGRRGAQPPVRPLVEEELAATQQPAIGEQPAPMPTRAHPVAAPRTASTAVEETPPPRAKPPQSSRPPTDVEESPGQAVRTVQAPPRVAPRPPGGNSLSGVSRQYDDLDCQRIQARHGVRVPATANILEIDGQRLPLANLAALAECPAPYLYLPRGKHAVKFRKSELPLEVTIASDLSQVYHEMRQFFNAGGKPREAELLSRGAKALDVHNAPFLLNLMGAAHYAKEQNEAAQRKFRRALRVNPLFAPAHLNLAALLHKQGAKGEALQELQLAEATNVGNCFGLSPAIYEVRRQLGLPPGQSSGDELALSTYVTQELLSEEDRRMTALMQGLAKYAVENAERGKIINNLAIHFADQGNIEQALDHFRSALGVLKLAGPERFKLAQHVLTQMGETCRKAKYEEADEYDRMRSLVQP